MTEHPENTEEKNIEGSLSGRVNSLEKGLSGLTQAVEDHAKVSKSLLSTVDEHTKNSALHSGNLTRRQFFKRSALVAGGAVIGWELAKAEWYLVTP